MDSFGLSVRVGPPTSRRQPPATAFFYFFQRKDDERNKKYSGRFGGIGSCWLAVGGSGFRVALPGSISSALRCRCGSGLRAVLLSSSVLVSRGGSRSSGVGSSSAVRSVPFIPWRIILSAVRPAAGARRPMPARRTQKQKTRRGPAMAGPRRLQTTPARQRLDVTTSSRSTSLRAQEQPTPMHSNANFRVLAFAFSSCVSTAPALAALRVRTIG